VPARPFLFLLFLSGTPGLPAASICVTPNGRPSLWASRPRAWRPSLEGLAGRNRLGRPLLPATVSARTPSKSFLQVSCKDSRSNRCLWRRCEILFSAYHDVATHWASNLTFLSARLADTSTITDFVVLLRRKAGSRKSQGRLKRCLVLNQAIDNHPCSS
jgi:hypothetical protein